MTRKIVYSPGYGAGWVSWNYGKSAEVMLTYKPIIEFLEAGNKFTDKDCHTGYEDRGNPLHPLLEQLIRECRIVEDDPEYHVCVLGADQLRVAEVQGRVRINEYDGSESYETEYDTEGWM